MHAGRQSRLSAAQVGHQRQHRQAGQRERMRHHFSGVGQLRQQTRRHKRADLDLAQAGGVQCADPAQLVSGRHAGIDGLQAISRADLADQDRGSVHGAVSHGLTNFSPAASKGLMSRVATTRPQALAVAAM